MSSIMVSHISPSLPNDDGGWHAARGGLARVAEAGQGHGLGPEAGAALAQQATGGGMRGKAGRGLKDGSGAGKADAEKLGARTPTLKRCAAALCQLWNSVCIDSDFQMQPVCYAP